MPVARTKSASRDVAFTHVDKLMFPAKGYTKGDVLSFYEKISSYLLPHLKDRPITLERLPDGLANPKSPRFWQKNTPDYYPSWIKRIDIPTDDGKHVHYTLVNDLPTLLYLVNQGALTFHTFLSRVKNLDHPDYILFDLDPGKAGFPAAVTAAKALHKILDQKGVESFPKTSGKSGLHVLVPSPPKSTYESARAWATDIAERVVDVLPDLVTTERQIAARGKRLYLDVIQNARGHHVVPPYVLRVTPGATVSTPLKWSEFTPRLSPAKFDIRSIFKRLRGKDPMLSLLE